MPMWVRLRRDGDLYVLDRYVWRSDRPALLRSDRGAWKTVAIDETTGALVVPQGSIGYRWPGEGEAKGRWNLEAKDGETKYCRSHSLTSVADRTNVSRPTTRVQTCSCAACRASASRSPMAKRS